MSHPIKTVNLLYKGNSPEATGLARDIALWLEKKDVRAHMIQAGKNLGSADNQPNTAVDLNIVLGGDGTILGVARVMLAHKIPLLGINHGNVGMLAPVSPQHWEAALNQVLDGKLIIEPRLALGCKVTRLGNVVYAGAAINDVTVSRGSLARLVALDVHLNGEYLGELRTDGVLVSTPTGSSGYCLSAGGPVVPPRLNCLIIVPICPFLQTMPPMLVEPDSEVEIIVSAPANTEAFLTCDGQQGMALETGDKITIAAAPQKVLIGHLPGTSFLSQLKDRGII